MVREEGEKMNSQLTMHNSQLKEGYKKTDVGVIPEDWEVKKIESVIKLQGGYAFKSKDFAKYGIKVLKITNIKSGYLNFDECEYYPDEKSNSLESYFLREGDTVIAMSGATTGKTGKVTADDIPCLLNQRVGRFELKNRISLDKIYLYYYTNSHYFQNRIWNYAIGGAQPNISSEQIESILIPLPPLKEQKKIATILSSVDEHVEEVDGIIEDLKELKKGLMQKLLTGEYSFDNSQLTIDNGQLKDEEIRLVKTKEFKKTKLGVIPKHWEVKKLGELVNIEYGGSLPNGKRMGGQYPVYGSNGIVGFHNEKLAEGPTIILGRKGSIDKVTYVSKDCFPIDTTYYLINRVNIDIKWLASLLSMQNLRRLNTATGVPSLNRNDLNYMSIPIPPLQEQKKISSILSSIDERIQTYEKQKEDIEELKKGLMQQLLTGKKRVLNN